MKYIIFIIILFPSICSGQSVIYNKLDSIDTHIQQAQDGTTPFTIKASDTAIFQALHDWKQNIYYAKDTSTEESWQVIIYCNFGIGASADPLVASSWHTENASRKIIYLKDNGEQYTGTTMNSTVKSRLRLRR